MSLKSTFLTLKKSCTSCPNWGEGGGEVIWTKSKRTATFFGDVVPKPCWAFLTLFTPAGGLPNHMMITWWLMITYRKAHSKQDFVKSKRKWNCQSCSEYPLNITPRVTESNMSNYVFNIILKLLDEEPNACLAMWPPFNFYYTFYIITLHGCIFNLTFSQSPSV